MNMNLIIVTRYITMITIDSIYNLMRQFFTSAQNTSSTSAHSISENTLVENSPLNQTSRSQSNRLEDDLKQQSNQSDSRNKEKEKEAQQSNQSGSRNKEKEKEAQQSNQSGSRNKGKEKEEMAEEKKEKENHEVPLRYTEMLMSSGDYLFSSQRRTSSSSSSSSSISQLSQTLISQNEDDPNLDIAIHLSIEEEIAKAKKVATAREQEEIQINYLKDLSQKEISKNKHNNNTEDENELLYFIGDEDEEYSDGEFKGDGPSYTYRK